MDRAPKLESEEDPIPHGSSEERGESLDLKDQLEHQRVVIAQFKEMLQKTDQSNVMQEKVDRYASTLSKMTMRAKRSKLKKESGSIEKQATKSSLDAPVNEKISMLRRQLEENKVKLAERGKSQKDIEEMVHQLKAQFDDSLQLIHDTSTNFTIVESKADYNKSSSSEELYNILMTKEKKIADLNSKVQKLETVVLDLQENLKEKDCVINARTEAVTLMSESLSKKTKNTQDTLDETKEHMKKMQKDFIQLENEMKARQMKLLDDLRLKNLEIAELQELNQSIKSSQNSSVDTVEVNDWKDQIMDLSNQIQESKASYSSLKNKYDESQKKINDFNIKLQEQEETRRHELELKQNIIDNQKTTIENLELKLSQYVGKDAPVKQSDEVEKLRKELDELNKNMIKVKSENKKKIKLLNKKIDSFKKIGDMNAHIVKLSEVNDNLNERIAELEEEKGNYQLKMMEESKDAAGRNTEEMEKQIKELTETLDCKLREFESLLTDNTCMKNEIEHLNEKLRTLSAINNEKVTSEISFIQYEEKLQREMGEVLAAKEKLQIDNNDLLEKLDALTKEKSELHSKLEQYLQENMELIDKLEKMSAEKVSSAESIEMVETLTLQEKLEIDEYQKNLDPQSGKLKTSEEHIDENPDLNDSVNRLTEETAELLQKIELFTVERREVMEKMESLSTENAHLNLKLKQVENSSELLTETYEQLQSEKKQLDEKLESLERENDHLKNDLMRMNKDKDTVSKQKLFDLEGEVSNLSEENENLRLKLKTQSDLVHEKNELLSQLEDADRKLTECESKINQNLEEIRLYQSVIEENKDEFIKFSVQLNELKDIITKKDTEICTYKSEIEMLNTAIKESLNTLENKSLNEETIQDLETQISNLKTTLNENSEQISDYENELKENSSLIKQLNQKIKELNNKNLELQSSLENKDVEQENIISDLKREITELQSQIKEKDEMIHKVTRDMNEKLLSLQEHTDFNSEHVEGIKEPLKKKIEELTTKNNALVERMKKIAANLKKKTISCQELEKELSSSKEKWEIESKEKDLCIQEAQKEIQELKAQTESYQSDINQLKNTSAGKIDEDKLQEQQQPLKNDLSLHEELLESNFVQEIFVQDNENKVQELELIVESQLTELSAYKERISRLEEMLSKMDEKRESLEQKTNELGVQLAEKSQSFEEISKTEDVLEKKLENLSQYKEEIEKRLEDFTEDNQKLISENSELREAVEKLKQKLTVAHERVNELSIVEENSAKMEEELEISKKRITILEQELQKFEHERVLLQESAKLELEKLDNDWQLQFESIAKEKLNMSVLSEKLNERIAELAESEHILLEKIEQLESKVEKSIELQASYDLEISTQKDEIQALKDKVEEKNEIINDNIIEIRNLQLSKQLELDEVEKLKKENEVSNSRIIQMSQELHSTENLFDTNKETESFIIQQNPRLFKEDTTFNPVQGQIIEMGEHEAVIGISTIQKLLQNFKSLEFMLQNMDSNRDEVMDQCSYLSNELMNIIHYFSRASVEEQLNTDLEVTQDEIPILKTEKVSPLQSYPDNETDEAKVLHSIESYILPEKQLEVSAKELEQLEFTKTRDLTDSTNPFLETPIQKKDMYLCYPEKSDLLNVQSDIQKEADQLGSLEQVHIDAFGENDDGWGWNQEEAKLEELQNQEFETNPLRIQIVQLEDKMRVMEVESQNKQKEFQELQVKSAKLIKKLKELKVQNEKLQNTKRQADHGDSSLESAIQEELKIQIETLEKKVCEVENELTKEKNEKEALQKKHDLLSSSNQRMIEMKEKNDIEMLMWQRKIGELQSKLDQIDWKESEDSQAKLETSDCGNNSNIQELQKKIAEMDETIKELSLDNEELQVLLEEQRTLRISAERAKSIEPHLEDKSIASEYAEMLAQKQNLETELNRVLAEKVHYEKEFNRVNSERNTDEFKEIIIAKQNIESKLQIISAENERLQNDFNYIFTVVSNEECNENVDSKQILDKLNEIIIEKKKLQNHLNDIIQRNDEQQRELNNLLEEKLLLEKVVEEKSSEMEKMMQDFEHKEERMKLLEIEKTEDELKIRELLNEMNNLKEHNSEKEYQIDMYLSKEKFLSEEIQVKNDLIDTLLREKEDLLKDIKQKEIELENSKLMNEDNSLIQETEINVQLKNMEQLKIENQELTLYQKQLEEQIENLSKQIQANEAEFQIRTESLNQDWQAMVDKRGGDVAESWKIHLDMRETEFTQVEERLRKEINDLEEKCNSLVNENNELRKNVDTEIRNEVDRVSALQQQINERQQYIQELSQVLKNKQQEIGNLEQEISQLTNRLTDLQNIVEEKDIKLSELQIIVDTTQKQFDEKRIIVEEVVKSLEEKSLSPILFDLESIKKELNRQTINPDHFSNLQKDLTEKESIISNIENELTMKINDVRNYEVKIGELQSTICELEQKVNASNFQDEIFSLTNELKNKEILLSNIQSDYNAKVKELEESQLLAVNFQKTIEDHERNVNKISDELAEKEAIISSLHHQLNETSSLKASQEETTQTLHFSLQQCRLQCDELQLSLDEKCSLIDIMNAELEKQHNIHVERESDMEKLKVFVEELQESHRNEKQLLEQDKDEINMKQSKEINDLQNKLVQLQLYIDELTSEKGAAQESINSLQAEIQEQYKNIMELSSQIEFYKNLNDELGQKLIEFEEIQKKLEEQNTLLNEEEKQMDELKAIIENQVVTIEDLKRNLFEKSNDYDCLIAEMDIRRNDLTVKEPSKQIIGQEKSVGPVNSDELNDWVTRSELDIALYMLHQRDVRCEELTVELTQLLEERDTLQLRLSNALREKEEYRRVMSDGGKTVDISISPKSSPSRGAIPKGKVSDILLSASGAEIATEAEEKPSSSSENQLENKLSELKNIGYKRDKTLLDEQQQRRLQQLSIMQQHIDEASKLPPEAAARLVDANYTLSRDVQSPSKVLLNWLWGRSTPKVNDL